MRPAAGAALSIALTVIVAMLALPAAAQDRIPATVTGVVDGDTIKVQNDAGGTFTVRHDGCRELL
jgi:endonuclease YncB( thermonuclease family)